MRDCSCSSPVMLISNLSGVLLMTMCDETPSRGKPTRTTEARGSRVRALPLPVLVPQCQTKEHTGPIIPPSQVKRQKRRQQGRKGKMFRTIRYISCSLVSPQTTQTHDLFRHLRPDRVDEQKGRVAAQQKRIRPAFTFPS